MFELIAEALTDTLRALPFLFFAYVLIEYMEHHVSLQFLQRLMTHNRLGIVVGALLGVIPQCGFSVTAANFYTSRLISAGTLVAVFLATSDEAIPILIAEPGMLPVVWKMILLKLIIAIAAGILLDMVWKKKEKHEMFHELCHDCHCEERSFLRSAAYHTLKLGIFLLAVNLILGGLMEFASGNVIRKMFLDGNVFQPFLTALIGLIPNCAASVALTELYLEGHIAFGSLAAGLCSGAGLGIAVLFRTNKSRKENLIILGWLYLAAVVAGGLINVFL